MAGFFPPFEQKDETSIDEAPAAITSFPKDWLQLCIEYTPNHKVYPKKHAEYIYT